MRMTKMIEKILNSCVESGLVKQYLKGTSKVTVTYYDDYRQTYSNKEYMMTDLANMSSIYHSED